MVKRVTVILLTFAIVLKISAAQESYQERDNYSDIHLPPEDYETIDTFHNFRDQGDYANQESTYTRPDRDVTQSNDFFNFNRNNQFLSRDNEQNQVTRSDTSGSFSTPAVNNRNNYSWDVNRGSNSVNIDSSNSQKSSTDVDVNNSYDNTNRLGGGISYGSSRNFPNILNKSAPTSGFNFGFNVDGARNQQESSGNNDHGITKGDIINGAKENFNNVFRTANGKLVKLVPIDDNLEEDFGSSIPLNSQDLKRIQESIDQKTVDVTSETSTGKGNNFRFGGNANINIDVSKNIDLTDVVNGKLNFVNGATGKIAGVTGGLIHKAGTFANAKSGAVENVKRGVLDTTGAIASAKTKAIQGAVNGVAGAVGSIKTGLLETGEAVVNAKGNAIRGTVNSVAGKVGNIRNGLINKAGAVAGAKTNAIRGTVNAVTGKVDHITGGLLNTAGAIANAKTGAIRGAVNGITGKVDNLNKFLLNKAGLVVDAKTGAILGIVNRKSDSVANIKGGLLDTAGSIAGAKSHTSTGSINSGIGNINSGLLKTVESIAGSQTNAISGSVNNANNNFGNIKSGSFQASGTIGNAKSGSISGSISIGSNKSGLTESVAGAKSGSISGSEGASINDGGLEGSGSVELNKRGALIAAFSPLGIGKKIVKGGVVKAGAVASGIKSGALNVTDRIIHPGKYYGIGAIKRRVVNNILDDVQDELQTKIGNVVGTIGQVGEGVKNHITDLSIIDNHGDKNVLRIVNGLYDTQFYLNDLPVEQAYVIFSDESQPVDFFGETLDTQQRIIEECIPFGQVYIAYKPDCVNVEEDELSSQNFITAQNEVKNHLNVIVDSLFEKYGDQIISKAVSLTNGRL
ncbi:hypothetical protein LSTR_LSTR009713 [Laodelphax striatellus]|uniref:Uncharacterized protein n=1 Tax=Laodelphax striatellus TaxID=195883 RepID=A0A482WWG1_LAOST|nr:hypothetical protein LSTR_LSTR009713 [Laodelphax striatellus]